MKIAIHQRDGSFSDRWIIYCQKNKIDFRIVNCYDSNIIEQLKDCFCLLWHHHHNDYRDSLFAKGLLFALEQSGLKVFPDFNTAWHFDDKVGQKYLLEGIKAPLVPSYVFYEKKVAKKWVKETEFPKVFKLRGGAGASNVCLVRNRLEANKKINSVFGKGITQFDRIGHLKDYYFKLKDGKIQIIDFAKALGRSLLSNKYSNVHGRVKGYAYFQDFIPNNDSDIRIIVIGKRAFGLKRMTRKNDFRASGSGIINYDPKEIDELCVKIAFETNLKLKSQSIAFDFVFDENNDPLIVEISYGYSMEAYDKCPGFWNDKLQWITESFNPQEWIIKNLLYSATKG